MNSKFIIFLGLLFLLSTNFVLALEEVDRNYALKEINDSEKIITEFTINNFSTQYMGDLLLEAKSMLKQVDYAEMLRGNMNASANEIREANLALQLIKWKNLSYSDVILFTDKIKEDKARTFLIYDKLSVAEGESNSSDALIILDNAKNAFYNGRYNETERYLQDFDNYLEAKRIEQTRINILTKNTKNFFQKYWIEIVAFLLILTILIYFLAKMRLHKTLRNKIEKMQFEKQALDKLIRKSQRDRFEKNKISGLVYNIQMEKYKERLQEIEYKLPVLEAEFKKGKKIKKRK